MCVFWLWRVPPCWYQGVGKGRRCHFLDAVSSSWRNTAADEMLAELVFEFSHVIDICTRQDRKVLYALLWLLIWLHNNNFLMAVNLLSQEL